MTQETDWRAEQQDEGLLWRVVKRVQHEKALITVVVAANLTEAEARLIAAASDMARALKLWMSDTYDHAAEAPEATIAALTKAGRAPQ